MTTFAFVKKTATPHKLIYTVEGDGAAVDGTLANATLLADCVGGPLKNALNQTYTNQAAMQAVFGGGAVRFRIRPRGAEFACGVDVDVDAVTPTKPEVNLTAVSAPAATIAYLDIEYVHSVVR